LKHGWGKFAYVRKTAGHRGRVWGGGDKRQVVVGVGGWGGGGFLRELKAKILREGKKVTGEKRRSPPMLPISKRLRKKNNNGEVGEA